MLYCVLAKSKIFGIKILFASQKNIHKKHPISTVDRMFFMKAKRQFDYRTKFDLFKFNLHI